MKHFILFLLMISILSCSKKNTPVEVPPVVPPPTTPTNNTPPTITSFTPLTAQIGSDVTIIGTGFGTDLNAVNVQFADGANNAPKSVTATQIVVAIPATVKMGKLTVTVSGKSVVSDGVFTYTAPNGYIVKTIGISRIMLATDGNSKITVAELFGGGNRVILKQGTGNRMDVVGGRIAVVPDAMGDPAGTVPALNRVIDNGEQAIDTTGSNAMVIKLKGFDKSKTGYNQLNLVMHKYLWVLPTVWGGYETNLEYIKFMRASGRKNADYGNQFLTDLFTGNINVSTVEIAKPKSEKPYITRDQIFTTGQAVSGINDAIGLNVKLTSMAYDVKFALPSAGGTISVGKPLKFEWVNATSAEITQQTTYVFSAKFNNMKIGGLDQIVEPTDSTNKVFLRITGFDANVTGFHQLRLFVANNGLYDGGLQLTFNAKPTGTPTLSFIKEVYRTGQNLDCVQLMPTFPHY